MYFSGSSVGTGISFGAISLDKLLRYQFKLIHWPGFRASDWFDYIGYPQLGTLAIVASGYIDTVLLLIAVVFIFRSLIRAFGRPGSRRPTLPSDPTEV